MQAFTRSHAGARACPVVEQRDPRWPQVDRVHGRKVDGLRIGGPGIGPRRVAQCRPPAGANHSPGTNLRRCVTAAFALGANDRIVGREKVRYQFVWNFTMRAVRVLRMAAVRRQRENWVVFQHPRRSRTWVTRKHAHAVKGGHVGRERRETPHRGVLAVVCGIMTFKNTT
eukprot:6184046-Pleurochrysis_carterae.AAC.3